MGDFDQTQDTVKSAVSNGVAPPDFPLPLPDNPDVLTANLLQLVGQTPNPFIYQLLVKHLHAFVREANLSTDEWMAAIQFLTRVGQAGAPPICREMLSLSSVLGVSGLVECINNPVGESATETSFLGPFYAEDAKHIEHGGSIASEGDGEQMYVEGRVLTNRGEPIADAIIDTWESDHNGHYDMEYDDGTKRDYRGRLHTAKDGSFEYRAIVPLPYALACDGPIGELLISQGRHNMRPSHLHMMVQAPGYHKLITSLYPEGDDYLTSDVVLGVKKSLVVKLEHVEDEEETRKRGFLKGGSFKLMKRDLVLLTEEQWRVIQQQTIRKSEESYLQVKDD